LALEANCETSPRSFAAASDERGMVGFAMALGSTLQVKLRPPLWAPCPSTRRQPRAQLTWEIFA
jgi:hypothetical protein